MKSYSTEINIFNEEGILSEEELQGFSKMMESQDSIKFTVSDGESNSSIFKTFQHRLLEFTLFKHGYVMSIEGDIKESILLLKLIDDVLPSSKVIYVSASQRVENDEQCKFIRGQDLYGIAQYLDNQFNNTDYTSVLNDSLS